MRTGVRAVGPPTANFAPSLPNGGRHSNRGEREAGSAPASISFPFRFQTPGTSVCVDARREFSHTRVRSESRLVCVPLSTNRSNHRCNLSLGLSLATLTESRAPRVSIRMKLGEASHEKKATEFDCCVSGVVGDFFAFPCVRASSRNRGCAPCPTQCQSTFGARESRFPRTPSGRYQGN